MRILTLVSSQVSRFGFLLAVAWMINFGSRPVLALPEQCGDICNYSSHYATECGIGYTLTTCLGYGVCDIGTSCGNDSCDGYAGETACNCETDCGECMESGVQCGNNVCEYGESDRTCSADCAPAGNPWCGDKKCNGSEDQQSCPGDCFLTYELCGGSTGMNCPSSYKCVSGRCMYQDGISTAQTCTSNNECGAGNICATVNNGPSDYPLYYDYMTGNPVSICISWCWWC